MIPLLLLLSLGCTTGRVPTAEATLDGVDGARLRFVALGDVGKGTDTADQVAQAAAKVCTERGCDVLLLLGDNLYPRGMEAPDDPRLDAWVRDRYADLGVPIWMVLGNHDYGHGRSRQKAGWQVLWAERTPGVHLPAFAWTLDAGPARLVGLDTNAALQFGERPQAELLREALEGHDGWRVVLGHHPFRSNGPHGNAGAYEGWRGVPWVSGGSLRRLFEGELCGAADLYLSGHEHTRQLLSHCGVELIVSGAGASTTELVDRGNTTTFASDAPGLVWVELRADGGTIAFHDRDGRVEHVTTLPPPAR